MKWVHSDRSSLLTWGEVGKPGASALLLQTPAPGANVIVGMLFAQADYASLPMVKAVSAPLSAEFLAMGDDARFALGTAIAMRNGLDKVYIEGAEVKAGGTTQDVVNDFEAWKQGILLTPGTNPVQVVRHDIIDRVAIVGQNLGLLMNKQGAIFPTTQAPRAGAAIDGMRVAIAVRDLAAGPYGAVPFVGWAKGQLDKLDMEAAKEALIAVSSPSSKTVSWYGDKSHPSHADRLQAAQTAPILAGIIAETGSIAGAVDRRMSSQPLLIERTGLTKGALKRLSKITQPLPRGVIFEDRATGRDALDVERVRRLTLKGRLTEDRACRILAELPPEWAPQNNEDWIAFQDVVSGAAIPLEEVSGISVKQTLQSSKGDWKGFRSTLCRAADMDIETFGRREIALSTSDAIEVVDELARHVVLPLVLSSIASTGQPESRPLDNDVASARQAAFDLVMGSAKSPGTVLFETARRWMSRIPALAAIRGEAIDEAALPEVARFEEYQDGHFPKFCDDFAASNGYVLRSLNSKDLLTEESARLGHCVGRLYQLPALNGTSYIVSVQNAGGTESYSTIEIAPPAPGQLALREVQHRGRRNVTPSAQATQAATEFYAAVRAGRHVINEPEIHLWREHRANLTPNTPQAEVVRMSTWVGALGVDPKDEVLRQTLWETWREILGGSYAEAETPEVLFRNSSIRALVDSLSPAAAKILRDQQAERRRQTEAVPALETPEP